MMGNAMFKPTFTPGPWRIRDTTTTIYWGEGLRGGTLVCREIVGADGRRVCDASPRHDGGDVDATPRRDADSQLIAAAPDLLAACQAYAFGQVDSREAERMMLAAIDKATT